MNYHFTRLNFSATLCSLATLSAPFLVRMAVVLLSAIILSLLIASPISAKTSLWKVEKDGQHIYLGGTIHVLRPADFPLPEAFDFAFDAADVITFETDLEQLNNPQLAQKMMQSLSYPDHRTVENQLSAKTYQQLKSYANGLGVSLVFMKKAKPGLLMSSLTLQELKKIGATQQGIDFYYLNQSTKAQKQTSFLETPQQQIAFLANLGIGEEESFYQNLLIELKQTETLFADMIRLWRSGDSDELDSLVNQMMKRQSPKLYQSLLVDRNKAWTPKIIHYFETQQIELVLVGVAHLIGEDGLINQLRRQGYQITQL